MFSRFYLSYLIISYETLCFVNLHFSFIFVCWFSVQYSRFSNHWKTFLLCFFSICVFFVVLVLLLGLYLKKKRRKVCSHCNCCLHIFAIILLSWGHAFPIWFNKTNNQTPLSFGLLPPDWSILSPLSAACPWNLPFYWISPVDSWPYNVLVIVHKDTIQMSHDQRRKRHSWPPSSSPHFVTTSLIYYPNEDAQHL